MPFDPKIDPKMNPELEPVIETLLQALKARDHYTYGHSRRVAQIALRLARAAGLSEDHQFIVEHASLFHDLGKIGIPDHILLKPAKLTPEEQEVMRLHPLKSIQIIQPLTHHPFFKAILPGISCHHERVDGLGYPLGLKDEEIPIDARIILIADTFDAMTTNRPYRNALPMEKAFQELEAHAGRQFDAKLVQVFIEDLSSSQGEEQNAEMPPLKKVA